MGLSQRAKNQYKLKALPFNTLVVLLAGSIDSNVGGLSTVNSSTVPEGYLYKGRFYSVLTLKTYVSLTVFFSFDCL